MRLRGNGSQVRFGRFRHRLRDTVYQLQHRRVARDAFLNDRPGVALRGEATTDEVHDLPRPDLTQRFVGRLEGACGAVTTNLVKSSSQSRSYTLAPGCVEVALAGPAVFGLGPEQDHGQGDLIGAHRPEQRKHGVEVALVTQCFHHHSRSVEAGIYAGHSCAPTSPRAALAGFIGVTNRINGSTVPLFTPFVNQISRSISFYFVFPLTAFAVIVLSCMLGHT